MKLLIRILILTPLLTASLIGSPVLAAEPCPQLRVRITNLEITPQQPAQQHIVKLTWQAGAPTCYTINQFTVKGTITFANGQTKVFTQTVPGNETNVQISVAGLATATSLVVPGMAPRNVQVTLVAAAGSSIAGSNRNMSTAPDGLADVVSLPPTSCLPLVEIQNVQAVMAEPVPTTISPHPKVKVSWQVNTLPTCYKIERFTVTVLLRAAVGTRSKSVTVPGTQRSVEIVFEDVPPSSGDALVLANVRASGTAEISGKDQRELQGRGE
jgi:hypothetical protein